MGTVYECSYIVIGLFISIMKFTLLMMNLQHTIENKVSISTVTYWLLKSVLRLPWFLERDCKEFLSSDLV